MLRVGLTGGIGAGKSTVSARLDELGAVIVDADQIAREVVAPGTAGFEAVIGEFGAGVIAEDGSLDRAELGRLVFGDEDRRAALNAIIHPLVYRRRGELVAQASGDAVVVEDIPLLVENGLGPSYPLVVVVHADAEERMQRLAARGLEPGDARARINAQASDVERREAADLSLENSGPVEGLLAQVDELWERRLVPFEHNLRTGRRAPRPARAVIVDHDPAWEAQARRLIDRLSAAVGERALRIDHVGSTAVPGLPAKDLIDIQIVAADLDSASRIAEDSRDAGFVPIAGRWFDTDQQGRQREKRVAGNADPVRAVNVLIQPQDSPVWRSILLFRDWLRDDAGNRGEYATVKRQLAAETATVDDYNDRKMPWIHVAVERAEAWAREVGWSVA